MSRRKPRSTKHPEPYDEEDLKTLKPGDLVTIVSPWSPYKGWYAVVTDSPEYFSPYGSFSEDWYIRVAVGTKEPGAVADHQYQLSGVRRFSEG